MSRQSTSGGILQDIVHEVDFPGLIQTDVIILSCIARHADWHTGEHSYPGELDMMKWARRDRRTIQRRLRFLERAGLIECTAKGHGHTAATYRLCLEHPAYRGGMEGRQREAASPKEGRHLSTTGAASGPERGGIQAQEGRHNSAALSEAHPKPIPPSQPGGRLHSFNTAIMGVPNKRETEELQKLITQHRMPVVQKMQKMFEDRPKGFRGVEQPWTLFFKEVPGLLAVARKAVAQEERENDPVLKAAQEKRQSEFESKHPPLANWGGKTRKELEEEEGPPITDLKDLLD